MADVLLLDRTDGVATLTMNRPESMNSLSVELKDALVAALADVGADPAVRAVVLTGTGRGFCVGQDLAEHVELLQAAGPAPLSTVEEHYNPLTLALAEMAKPVIAAVNGTAAGAGASLSFACDLRIVSDRGQVPARLRQRRPGPGQRRLLDAAPADRPGPGRWSCACWPSRSPPSRPSRYGLVTQLVPAEQVLPAAQELAARLAAGPTVAYAAIKQAMHFAGQHDLRASLDNEAVQQHRAGATRRPPDGDRWRFVNKQKPVFVGR